jgi:hypothetical protein
LDNIFFPALLKSWRIPYTKIPSFGGDEFFIRRESGSFQCFFIGTTDAWLFKDWFGYFLGIRKKKLTDIGLLVFLLGIG